MQYTYDSNLFHYHWTDWKWSLISTNTRLLGPPFILTSYLFLWTNVLLQVTPLYRRSSGLFTPSLYIKLSLFLIGSVMLSVIIQSVTVTHFVSLSGGLVTCPNMSCRQQKWVRLSINRYFSSTHFQIIMTETNIMI